MIPEHQLERLIGEGGFGQVWRARRDADGEIVAIKVLHLELVRSVDALTRFQRELDAVERLDHPNVVRGLGHGTLPDGRPYLILEYVEGPSLREVLHERGALPPAEMLTIVEPLCDALHVAHEAGLIHRDVKASNVILARRDGAVRPVLLDFGLVKLVDQIGPGLTSSRSMLGTPAAMAPEQMRGQPVDPRTDIYALGLLAYHVLTGLPAFGGAPGVVQSYLQVHGPRPRPSAKVDIDPAIDEPVARALSPEPADRFSDARSFGEALRAVIHGAIGEVQEVAVLYVEGDPADIESATAAARALGLTVALTAPDSVLAVVPRDRVDITALRTRVSAFSVHARVAIGISRATLSGDLVDGAALDVESWAPYPLPPGLWVADGL
ncbi:MAG TPA: serine/threonine-protein kinase [Kofleriaceae bacterium]|jgi:serine/threonine-protein kinase|nr:serine/threonine-protein kinase [Kofleriaceae bacterium]